MTDQDVPSSCRLRGLAGLLRARRAIALVEFAYTLPILMVLTLGGVELSNYSTTRMRLNQAALMIADQSARIGSGTLLSSKTISESQINDVLTGAGMAAGSLDLYTNGRVLLSSIQFDAPNSSSGNKRYRVAWQRCRGAKTTYDPIYAKLNDANNGQNKAGFGPAGDEVTSPLDDGATMFVEIYYEYQPLITRRYLYSLDMTIVEHASMPVRDRRDLTQIVRDIPIPQRSYCAWEPTPSS